MEATSTTPQVVIPEKTESYKVERISFTPGSLTVMVDFRITDPQGGNRMNVFEVDMTDEWSALSDIKKTDWKTMFRAIIAKTLNIAANTISGEIWE